MSIKKYFTKFYENPLTIGVTVPRTEMTWTPKRYNDMKMDWHENLNTSDLRCESHVLLFLVIFMSYLGIEVCSGSENEIWLCNIGQKRHESCMGTQEWHENWLTWKWKINHLVTWGINNTPCGILGIFGKILYVKLKHTFFKDMCPIAPGLLEDWNYKYWSTICVYCWIIALHNSPDMGPITCKCYRLNYFVFSK